MVKIWFGCGHGSLKGCLFGWLFISVLVCVCVCVRARELVSVCIPRRLGLHDSVPGGTLGLTLKILGDAVSGSEISGW